MRNATPAPHQINWDHVYGVLEVLETSVTTSSVTTPADSSGTRDTTTPTDSSGTRGPATPVTTPLDSSSLFAATPGSNPSGDNPTDATGDSHPKYSWLPQWPIDLETRKMDIKQAGQLRQMEQHVFQKHNGPWLVLAVHLCGKGLFQSPHTASLIAPTCTRLTLSFLSYQARFP
jgi:hypothetical protein